MNIFNRLLFISIVLLSAAWVQGQISPQAFYFTPGEDLLAKARKFSFIRVDTDMQEAYAGEAITAAYWLYVAGDIQGKLSKSPSFRGFASYEVEAADALRYDIKEINGVPFKVFLIRKVQLFGLRSGVQRIEPVALDATVRFRDMYYRGSILETVQENTRGDTLIQVSLKSDPKDIRILAVPAGKQDMQAVGNFQIEMYAAKNTLQAGRADTVYVNLRGKGNWHAIGLPQPVWPRELEVFEPRVMETLNPAEVPLQGLRSYAFPVVAVKPGTYTVPPLKFTFFDPGNKQAKTIQTDSVTIRALPAAGQKTTSAIAAKKDRTLIFTRYATWLFPLLAIVLGAIAFGMWRKGKSPKNPV